MEHEITYIRYKDKNAFNIMQKKNMIKDFYLGLKV